MPAAVDLQFAGMGRMELDQPILHATRQLCAKHRLRGADSIHLASAVALRDKSGDAVTMVACDAELIRAAKAEGLAVLDSPEDPPLPQ